MARGGEDVLQDFRFDAGSGSVQLVGTAAQLYLRWDALLRGALAPHASEVMFAPGIFDVELIERSGYGVNFPHQLVPTPPAGYLPPASCLAVYPSLRNRRLPVSVLIAARCGRNENHQWEAPFRLRSFTMIELVLVGRGEDVAAKRRECTEIVLTLFARLGIPGSLAPATDAFFLGAGSGARLLQQIKGLKREFVMPGIGSPPAALWSINNHERYFVDRFGLGDPDTESTCIAFGLERLTAAGLLLWGREPREWPDDLRP